MGFAGQFLAPQAKPGASIAGAYEQFEREEAAWKLQFNGQHRQWRTPNGITQTVDQSPAIFLHPWRSVLGPSRTVIIRQGRINLVPARIDGVTLDGRAFDGSAAVPPSFQIPDDAKPNGELESFVCAQIEIDLTTGKMIADTVSGGNTKRASPVTIVHMASPDPIYRDGGSLAKNQFGIRPIACLIWTDEKTIDRIEQIAVFDFTHEFKPPTAKGRGRHFFWV